MISIPFEKKEGSEKDIYEAVLNNCEKPVILNTVRGPFKFEVQQRG